MPSYRWEHEDEGPAEYARPFHPDDPPTLMMVATAFVICALVLCGLGAVFAALAVLS